MKHPVRLFFILTALLCPAARATTYSYNLSATIPDGDLNGYQNSQTVGGLQQYLTDVNVVLNISGGFNGDFYAYLTHNSHTAILLNRVGRSSTSSVGYPDGGFGPDSGANAFTLDDQAGNDIHAYRSFGYALNGSGQLTGLWQPDGRAIDPLSSGTAFSSASRTTGLSVFNGVDPNGLWTLYVADVSPGGEGALAGWGLQITAVPEPSFVRMLIVPVMAGFFRFARRRACRWAITV
jgi:subtilisin-like proprotein convertase family protein